MDELGKSAGFNRLTCRGTTFFTSATKKVDKKTLKPRVAKLLDFYDATQ